MKTNPISYKDNKCTFNGALSHAQMILCAASPVDEFYREESCDCDGQSLIMYTNPLQVLLNQKRLDNIGSLGIEQIKQWLEGTPSSDLAKLRSQCSDDDLASLIKSKHLQAPAEILAWSKHMTNKMETFTSEVQQLIATQQQPQEQQTIVEQKPE